MNGYELPHDKILDKPELGKIIHSEIASLVCCHSGGGGAWGGLRQQLGQQASPHQYNGESNGQGAVLGRMTIKPGSSRQKSAPSTRLGSSRILLAVRFSPMASFKPASKIGVRPAHCQSWRRQNPGGRRHQAD